MENDPSTAARRDVVLVVEYLLRKLLIAEESVKIPRESVQRVAHDLCIQEAAALGPEHPYLKGEFELLANHLADDLNPAELGEAIKACEKLRNLA